MNDENEIIRLSCKECKKFKEGTYEELFEDSPSLKLMPKLTCVCGGEIALKMTGKYKEQNEKEKEKAKA